MANEWLVSLPTRDLSKVAASEITVIDCYLADTEVAYLLPFYPPCKRIIRRFATVYSRL